MIKEYLDNFWKSAQTENRLKLLKKYAVISVCNSESWTVRRSQFKENKLVKAKSCFVCNQKPYERHHIIQLQNGGTNEKRNIVALCTLCHDNIHPWLKELRVKDKVIKLKPAAP